MMLRRHASMVMVRIARMLVSLFKWISDESPSGMNPTSIKALFYAWSTMMKIKKNRNAWQ